MEDSADSQERAAAEALFADVERAHRAEDVGAYVSFFDEDAVWVTSRGVCYRGRSDLGHYLQRAIPGGLGDGSVRYIVESMHSIGPNSAMVVVDQTYTNRDGEPRDEHARHTHTYVVSLHEDHSLILAGQNTMRVATDTLGRPDQDRRFLMSRPSFVVTRGAQGVGLAITQRLAEDGHVVVLDVATEMTWADPAVLLITGDAREQRFAAKAAERAECLGPLSGWVNNAAIFKDAALDTGSAQDVLDLITANLALTVTGCHTAVNHYLRHSRPGAIVNVSSHQAQRAVRGALPYATAKAAVEGLTRAVAVDHGPAGIRTNGVALGSISTARYEAYRAQHPKVDAQMAALHPLGRVGTSSEVAGAVAFLLSPHASYINGAILPIDGGRASMGADPEAVEV